MRLARIEVAYDLLRLVLQLPENTRIVDHLTADRTIHKPDTIEFIIEWPELQDVREGNVIPRVTVLFRRIEDHIEAEITYAQRQ